MGRRVEDTQGTKFNHGIMIIYAIFKVARCHDFKRFTTGISSYPFKSAEPFHTPSVVYSLNVF